MFILLFFNGLNLVFPAFFGVLVSTNYSVYILFLGFHLPKNVLSTGSFLPIYSVYFYTVFGKKYYDNEGYIYKILIDDSKGINVNKALGDRSPYRSEKEFAVIKRIEVENIKAYKDAKKFNRTIWDKIFKKNKWKKTTCSS